MADALELEPQAAPPGTYRQRVSTRCRDCSAPNHKPGKNPVGQDVNNRVLKLVQGKRPEAATHWSTRSIAKHIGISHTKIHQILRAHGLVPVMDVVHDRTLE